LVTRPGHFSPPRASACHASTNAAPLAVLLTPRDRFMKDFDIETIEDVCRRHAGESLPDLPGHLFSAIHDFNTNCKQLDDMTAAYFHFTG
jgi:hypothetical protein